MLPDTSTTYTMLAVSPSPNVAWAEALTAVPSHTGSLAVLSVTSTVNCWLVVVVADAGLAAPAEPTTIAISAPAVSRAPSLIRLRTYVLPGANACHWPFLHS